MVEALDSNAAPQPGEAGKAPRRLWDRVLTTTPVVLTVAATLLAGQSSSEMTRAQYHRSLASQNQAKAGDQWAFYQAKRTRKIILDKTGDLLDAWTVPDTVDAAAVQALAGRLPDDLEQARCLTLLVCGDLSRAEEALGNRATPTRSAADALLNSTGTLAGEARELQKRLTAALRAEEEQNGGPVFVWLNNDQLPPLEERRVQDAQVARARQLVADRKPEGEIDRAVLAINPGVLRDAMDAAEANAAAFDEAVKPVDKRIQNLGQLVNDEGRLIRRFYRAVRDLKLALADAAAEGSKALGDLLSLVDRLDRQAAGLKESLEDLNSGLRAAANRFAGRRYEGEAHYNQECAFLYEVQVHLNSALSDRHLARSRDFFYGLVLVQLAVTVATLALAVQQKSLLWALASIAGTAALIYSVYVYLDLIP